MSDVQNTVRGTRGESFADVARRTGAINGVDVAPTATDQQVLDTAAGSIQAPAQAALDLAVASVKPVVDLIDAARTGYHDAFTLAETNLRWRIDGEDWPTEPTFANGFKGWCKFVDGPDIAGQTFSAAEMLLNPAATATHVRFRLATRLIAGGSPNRAPFTGADVTVLDFTHTLSELEVTAGGGIVRRLVPLPVPIAIDALKSYGLAVEALDAGGDPIELGMGQSIVTPGSLAQRERGYYRLDGPAFEGAVFDNGTTTAFALPIALLSDSFADFADIPALRGDVDLLRTSFDLQSAVVAVQAADSVWPHEDAYEIWEFRLGDEIPSGYPISRIVNSFTFEAATLDFVLQVRTRPSANADGYGFIAGDVIVVDDLRLPLAALDLEADAAPKEAALPVPSTLLKADGLDIIVRWSALKADDVPADVGIGRTQTTTGLTQGRRGYTVNSFGVVPIPEPYAIAFRIESDRYVVAMADAPYIYSTADDVVAATAVVDELDIAVTGKVSRMGVILPFGDSVTLDAPAGGTFTDVAKTLTWGGAASGWPYLTARLSEANLVPSTIVVKDASTMAVLVAGVDYAVDPVTAAFGRATSGAVRNVLISAQWTKGRYDLICAHPETLALSAVKGPERIRDAAEFVPDAGTKTSWFTPDPDEALPPRLPLFTVFVGGGTAEAVPVWNIRDGVARELEHQFAADLRANQRAIRPLLDRLTSGGAVTISAMGDSITAIQSQQGDRLVPNGPYRDVATWTGGGNNYLAEGIIGTDLIDTIVDNYDNGDAAGATHTRFGRAWELVKAIDNRFAGAVTYKNFSIAGTNSDDSTLGMTSPDRLAAWAGSGAHLGLIADGMNSVSVASDTLFARIRKMIDAGYSAGMLGIVVLGCSRPNLTFGNYENWKRVNRVLRRAAMTPGAGGRTAAFIDMTAIYDGAGAGVQGIVAKHCCLTNGFNHPGVRQHGIEGGYAVKVLLG